MKGLVRMIVCTSPMTVWLSVNLHIFGAVAQLVEYRIVYPVVAGSNPVSLAMVVVAQSVRASDCGSEGHGFKSHQPPYAVSPNGIGERLWKIASENNRNS
jgi:hypothetical protein